MKYVLSILSGVLIGTVFGFLYAPKAGKRSRNELRKNYRSMQSTVEKEANKKLDEVKDILNKQVEEKAVKAKKTINSLKDTITS